MKFSRTLTFFFLVLLISCAKEEMVIFPVYGTGSSLYAAGRAAQEGSLNLWRPKKMEYRFDSGLSVPPLSSLEIEYEFSSPPPDEIKEKYQIVLETDGASWALPMDLSFMGIAPDNSAAIHYAVPIDDSFSGRFGISVLPAVKKVSNTESVFKIKSLRIRERWFGFSAGTDGGRFYTSPFVFKSNDGSHVIDLPAFFSRPPPQINVSLSAGQRASLELNDKRIEAQPGAEKIYLPPAIFPPAGRSIILSGDRIAAFHVDYSLPPAYPEPIEADPGLVFEWPRERWRNSSWEIFRWEQFPSLLIIDTVDYAVQDRLLKRLAFFVEKAGFRGRLASDAEIAGLHGWNAHDYRAEDLARFFDMARKTAFPLLTEERELEKILLNEGIIRADSSGIAAGNGGIISLSRESADYLRRLFLAHEGFHGLFFIDEDFRNFSRNRWNQFPAHAKNFIRSYFEYQQYDIRDEYLLVNEFMAHLLQQPASQAGRYFGQTLPSRLENSWRSSVLPQKDEASSSWPSLATVFTAEAEAFSAYVSRRWGLAAGRVWLLTVR
ncbi:MAG: hypothetical protein FWG99_05280 [Treponema sp.]|nr:hypothetical protein [Treponema sp.]